MSERPKKARVGWRHRKARYSVLLALVLGLVLSPGCDNFLGLEDWQRDLLNPGWLAIALLVGVAGAAGAIPPSPPAPAPVPGADGAAGADGVDGADGADGARGADGVDGTDGVNCWDTDEDGVNDAAEDINGDGFFTTADCQGPAGPAFFNIFVEDIFSKPDVPWGDIDTPNDLIAAPQLGEDVDGGPGNDGILAYRVAMPSRYTTGNPITMRLFFGRHVNAFGTDDGCFVFRLDAFQLRHGETVSTYDDAVGDNTRYVHVDLPALLPDEAMLVIDLPLNVATGLDFDNDLVAGQLLAFELNTTLNAGGDILADFHSYALLGVEFFESAVGDATVVTFGATVLAGDPGNVCP